MILLRYSCVIGSELIILLTNTTETFATWAPNVPVKRLALAIAGNTAPVQPHAHTRGHAKKLLSACYMSAVVIYSICG